MVGGEGGGSILIDMFLNKTDIFSAFLVIYVFIYKGLFTFP